jgi:hypothetical protein
VVLSGDLAPASFVDDILAEMVPTEPRTTKLRSAQTCLAAIIAPVWFRLLIIDSEPPDMTSGVLIESVKMSDPGLPILLVRQGWDQPPVVQGHVSVFSGPFIRREIQETIINLLVPFR